jgi:phage FluMu protein gp41
MTVVADNKKRVTIRHAKPGDRFDVQIAGEGKFVLTKLEPIQQTRPVKVRIEKRDGYSVGVLDRPISEVAIKETLSEFP